MMESRARVAAAVVAGLAAVIATVLLEHVKIPIFAKALLAGAACFLAAWAVESALDKRMRRGKPLKTITR